MFGCFYVAYFVAYRIVLFLCLMLLQGSFSFGVFWYPFVARTTRARLTQRVSITEHLPKGLLLFYIEKEMKNGNSNVNCQNLRPAYCKNFEIFT